MIPQPAPAPSSSTAIADLRAREVLDSRGNPTVEVECILEGGARGRAIVPSGASTGSAEALELRDEDPRRYGGKGVLRAVTNVHEVILPALRGRPAHDQEGIDRRLIDLDGTPSKCRLGANAILGVSLAVAHAAAAAAGQPLYRYLAQGQDPLLPLPMVNMISGGLHAGRTLDVQDFLAIPVGASSYPEALAMVVAVFRGVGRVLADWGMGTQLVADEGGYGPPFASHRQALDLLVAGIRRAGYRPGEEVAIAVDVAASHFYRDGRYLFEGRTLDAASMVDLLAEWAAEYPILSYEDGLAEEDWAGWALLTARLGQRLQLIGDDLFATNPGRLARGIESGVANAVLVKPNQIGTLSETLAVLRQARAGGYRAIVSARSGETEDTTIADLAVASGAGQIKIGAVTRGERLAKYNQLLRIAEELGPAGRWAGRAALGLG